MSTLDSTGAPRPLAVGDQLGQYKLVELIAVGGMGLVYRAYDASLDRYVAIKVLAPELARDPETAQRFLNEARAAAALNHPNVVHVYTAGAQGGNVYFAMELVTGEQIETLLARHHQMPIREAVEFIRQSVLGLQHAYEHGLIHGDVKPANFLVTETGTVKVSDFGLVRPVKAAPGSAENESLYGTPGYVSPEAITGHRPDHRSDIYSLGATLFHILTGQPPFVGATADETLHLHTHAPVPSIQTVNPNVPASLAQIITRMLAKDPAARYQTYAELLQTLDRYLGERHLAGPRPLLTDAGSKKTPVTAPVLPPPSPRRESPLSLILTLISVIACGVIVFLVYRAQLAGKRHAPVAPKPVAAPVVDREKQAAAEFKALKAAADVAAADGQLGHADEIYARQWLHDRYAGTVASQAVAAERVRLRSTAGQQWQVAQAEVKKLQAAGKFAEAITVCERQAHACAGFDDLPQEIAGWHHTLEQEQHAKAAATAAATAAAEAAAAEAAAAADATAAQARQARLQQLQTELPGLITSLQWNKGRQAVQAALADAGKDVAYRQELERWQTTFDGLLALRTGMSTRLKTAPSVPVTLQTTRGEFKGQVISFDTDRVMLRQTFGETGFAETAIAWSDLTPASVCRLFFTGLDAGQPDEMIGYAVFLAQQALAKQARLEDAKQTLQALVARLPAKAAVLQAYLNQFAELERLAQEAAALRQREMDALTLWTQLQAGLTQNQWPKVNEILSTLTNNFSNTEFVKGHTGDLQRVTEAIAQHIVPKGFAPLDIAVACNASFFQHATQAGNNSGFTRGTFIGDLPDNGVVLLRNTEPGGAFQLRTADKSDAIGLTWATGRFPTSVIVKLPALQQRRYSQLAVLSAASIGSATISVRFVYETGEPEELKFKTFDWSSKQPPSAANIAMNVTAVSQTAENPGQMYLNLIETDKQRRLTAIAFTWISANTEHPQHCVGIFAISGVAAEN